MSDHLHFDAWTSTGQHRFCPRGIFRRYAVLQVQERRRVFRPIVSGHSPVNWSAQTRWRDATFREALEYDYGR